MSLWIDYDNFYRSKYRAQVLRLLSVEFASILSLWVLIDFYNWWRLPNALSIVILVELILLVQLVIINNLD